MIVALKYFVSLPLRIILRYTYANVYCTHSKQWIVQCRWGAIPRMATLQ